MKVEPKKNLSEVPERLKKRFWKKVKKTKECWLWTGGGTTNRWRIKRGMIVFDKKGYLTNRLSWNIHFGKIDGVKLVLHKCDRPLCVRPNHLFLGNHGDNMRDMKKKGRAAKGEDGGRSILKLAQVLQIPKLINNDFTWQEIANKFGVAKCTIGAIIHKRNWKHVTFP